MLRRRRKTDFQYDGITEESASDLNGLISTGTEAVSPRDYLKFIFYCMLLAVPLYAITISIINHDWIMVIIDALIVPVGFVHGLLLLSGYVT